MYSRCHLQHWAGCLRMMHVNWPPPALQACLKALPRTRAGQRVNCVPGVTALSDKRRLVETLLGAYGSGAFTVIPRTFLLPQQYWDWRLWLLQQVRAWCPATLLCARLSRV